MDGGSLVLLLSNCFCDTFMSSSVAPTTFTSSGPAISSVTFAAASSVAVSPCLAPTTSPCTLEVLISGPCVSSTFSSPASASAGCMWWSTRPSDRLKIETEIERTFKSSLCEPRENMMYDWRRACGPDSMVLVAKSRLIDAFFFSGSTLFLIK